MMQYISTRGNVEPIGFRQAVLMGLSDDGGLLVPREIPDVRGRLDAWGELDYPELAFEVMSLYATDLPAGQLQEMIRRAYVGPFGAQVAPVVRAGELYILELFHGPTLAFKDVALQFLGHLFEHVLADSGGRMNILGATSGDTGSAAIYGVRGRDGIDIFMMHPRGGVSPIQQRQMTTVLDENVHNIAVEGSFDDCQRIMKTLAGDLDFKRSYNIGAVNSVNWARLLAQMVYYFKAALDVRRAAGSEAVRFCVPTGNFGNVLAGWYAMRMGAPISQLIVATNSNDILARFFRIGRYSRGKVYRSLSPAMDIQVASNFERYLYYRLGEDPRALREAMEQFERTGSLDVPQCCPGRVDPHIVAGAADDEQALETIRAYHERHGCLLDPHTAVGVCVAERLIPAGGEPIVCLATAHPAKFPEAIRRATGR
ncbi:MAG: threonine synthase, partial [Planctomycetes bacterium]|nr:threonine synthase [Planctomycetota bacterium]